MADRRKQVLIEGLRSRIRSLERMSSPTGHVPAPSSVPEPFGRLDEVVADRPSRLTPQPRPAATASLPPDWQPTSDSPSRERSRAVWTLGEPAFDNMLPGGGLEAAGLGELKPADHGDWPAAMALALCLAVRRRAGGRGRGEAPRPVLWCLGVGHAAEHGGLYGPGLAALGLESGALIVAEARRESDVLWAMEEGLRSGAASLVVGLVAEAGLTSSRRLALAAARSETPALLLTHPARGHAPAARMRLRLRRLRGGPHPLDAAAPGAARVGITIERCRGVAGTGAASTREIELEWCDVSYRFRLAAGVVDRAPAASVARRRAHG
jgi:protein ImuA